MLMPAMDLNSSADRCAAVPMPFEPCESSPGFALASAIRPLTSLTCSEGITTSPMTFWPSRATAAKSFKVS